MWNLMLRHVKVRRKQRSPDFEELELAGSSLEGEHPITPF